MKCMDSIHVQIMFYLVAWRISDIFFMVYKHPTRRKDRKTIRFLPQITRNTGKNCRAIREGIIVRFPWSQD